MLPEDFLNQMELQSELHSAAVASVPMEQTSIGTIPHHSSIQHSKNRSAYKRRGIISANAFYSARTIDYSIFQHYLLNVEKSDALLEFWMTCRSHQIMCTEYRQKCQVLGQLPFVTSASSKQGAVGRNELHLDREAIRQSAQAIFDAFIAHDAEVNIKLPDSVRDSIQMRISIGEQELSPISWGPPIT
jgi:hypothetical protein